jgi:uridine kinase
VRIIGIAGGTASGKTTVARGLVEALGDSASLVLHDRYYRSPPDDVDRATWNYDHPDSLETDLLVAHLTQLRQGRTIAMPRYDFRRHARADGVDEVPARPIVIVEGVLVLAEAALRACFDRTAFVHAPADLRLIRRMRRDVAERGRTPFDVLDQYLATVRPMHQRYVEASRVHAELVLDGTRPVSQLVEQALALLDD